MSKYEDPILESSGVENDKSVESVVILVEEDDHGPQKAAESEKTVENLTSDQNLDLVAIVRQSSEEQLENSIQKAIERTIKRFSTSSAAADRDENEGQDTMDAEDDDLSDEDEVLAKVHRRKHSTTKISSDEEASASEAKGDNIRHCDRRTSRSEKNSCEATSTSESSNVFQSRHNRKREPSFASDSTDHDIPVKKIRCRLPEQLMKPKARNIRKENEVNNNLTKDEASGWKPLSWHQPVALDELAKDEDNADLSIEAVVKGLASIDEEAIEHLSVSSPRSCRSEWVVSSDRDLGSDASERSLPEEDEEEYGGYGCDSINRPAKETNNLDKTINAVATGLDLFEGHPKTVDNTISSYQSINLDDDGESDHRGDSDETSDEVLTTEEDDDEDYRPEDDEDSLPYYCMGQKVWMRASAFQKYNKSQFNRKIKRSKRLEQARRTRDLVESNKKKSSQVKNVPVKFEIKQPQSKSGDISITEESLPKPLFKENSFEIDPAYLTPKLGVSEPILGKKAQETLNREKSLTVDRLRDLHGSLLARPTDITRAEDPRGLKVALMPHQQHALAWLQWREQQKPRGGVLADEMGLGKTLTMIALVMASVAKENDGQGSEDESEWSSSARGIRVLGGTLIVVPASLMAQWEAEVKTRCNRGVLKVEVYHGARRENVPNRLAENHIVITTYNIVGREHKTCSVLFKIRWRRVILDEAHVIRNHKSQPCVAVCALSSNKRWAVTGTPLHNREMDLYSLLKFLQCSPFDDVRVWRRWVDNKNDAGHERLATVMKTLMLRRTKEELQVKGELQPLPDKNVEVIEVTLDQDERLVYDKVMLYSRSLFAQFLTQRAKKARSFEMGGRSCDKFSWNDYRNPHFTKAQDRLLSLHADVQPYEILVLLIRLRQLCCHPSLIKDMLDKDDIELQAGTDSDIFSKMGKIKIDKKEEDKEESEDDFRIDERVTEHLLSTDNPVFGPRRRSSKLRAVIEKIKEILDLGDKVIVVSQWVGVLNIVAMELDSVEGTFYRKFTGQVPVKDRQSILNDFNSPKDKSNVLLLSLTAGGVGLNLVGANHMLLIDIHWNPQLETQAQDRIHRFGQTKNVRIYKYICTDTIEERVQALQDKKLELARRVLSGGGKVIGSKLSLDDIKSLFGM